MLLDQKTVNVTTDPAPCADDIDLCLEKGPVVRCARVSTTLKKRLVADINIFFVRSGMLAVNDGHAWEMEIPSAASNLTILLNTSTCRHKKDIHIAGSCYMARG